MTKHKSADERTAQILAAAKACFIERGYFATKMDEIAQKAGLSKGGVYFHFDSKKDIFHGLVEEEYQRTRSFLEEIAKQDGSFLDKLSHIGQYFTSVFEGPDNPRFLVVTMEMTLRDEEIARLHDKIQHSYLDTIEAMIEEGMKRGELKEVEPGVIAFLLKAMLDGIQQSYLEHDRAQDPAAIIEVALDMIINGLHR